MVIRKAEIGITRKGKGKEGRKKDNGKGRKLFFSSGEQKTIF